MTRSIFGCLGRRFGCKTYPVALLSAGVGDGLDVVASVSKMFHPHEEAVMRRVGIFLLAVIALVAMAGPVSAQPKVTITGFVDNMTTWTNNMSNVDNNYARTNDKEWYSRTRVRPDITAEVGTTKFVLGLEL